MNVDLAQELLNELGSALENVETHQTALLQFLKGNGILSDDQFATYLAQAGKASSVRWRAARIRLESLFSAERQKEEKLEVIEQHQAGSGQSSLQDHEREAKTTNDEGSANAASKTEEADTNGVVEGAGKQTGSEKDNLRDEPATSEDKKPGPTSDDGE